MRTDHEVRINYWNFNLPQIVTTVLSVAAAVVAIVMFFVVYFDEQSDRLSALENKSTLSEASYAARRASTDARFAKIEANMEPLGSLVFRVQQLEAVSNKQVEATDRQTSVLNDVRIAVGVLTQKVDSLASERRTDLQLDGPPNFKQ